MPDTNQKPSCTALPKDDRGGDGTAVPVTDNGRGDISHTVEMRKDAGSGGLETGRPLSLQGLWPV